MFSFFSFSKNQILASSLFGLLALTACSEATNEHTVNQVQASHNKAISQKSTNHNLPLLNVYKSPTCGCCEKWLNHIDGQGFQSVAHNSHNLSAFKQAKGIATNYRSCHTAVSEAGYIFEGHVPAKFIHQFLAEQQINSLDKAVLGLAVPAMPIGTPGMEVGDKFMPYKVLLLNSDGSSEIYAAVNSYQEQF